jgi:hypothetical protein
VQDDAGNLYRISGITPGRWHTFPRDCLRMKYLRLRSTVVGGSAAVAQANERELLVVTKS